MGAEREVGVGRRRSPSLYIVPVEEADVRRIADIMGDGSASARALVEFDRRRAVGEDVALFRAVEMTLVGPRPTGGGATEGEGNGATD